MFGLSSVPSAPSSLQLNLYQAKLQQARQEAAQAQSKVQSLEAQTESARQEAGQTQDTVRSLESQAPRRNTSINSQGQTTGRLLSVTA